MPPDSQLAPAFTKYIDRLFEEGGQMFWPESDQQIRDISSNAKIAVIEGATSSRVIRRLARRTGLTERFSNSPFPREFGESEHPIAIYDRWNPLKVEMPPESFDVLAIITTYNEVDIIEQLISRLRSDHIRVHVVDNWSTDGTDELLTRMSDDALVAFERYPAAGPSRYFELANLLGRVEEIANSSSADWIIHHDADEIREGPWRGISLRRALWSLQQWGYNCADHTVVNFRPTDNSWHPGENLEEAFQWFEFGDTPALFMQRKAWRNPPEGVEMAKTGGHDATFKGRRIFPYKFITRHYPIRSHEHGVRKILRERQLRWSPEERAKGWHAHYDHFDEESSFLWNVSELINWNEIDRTHLLQRLSGVGLRGNPWPGEGPTVDLQTGRFSDEQYRAEIEPLFGSDTAHETIHIFSPSEPREIEVALRNISDESWLRGGRNDVVLSSRWYVVNPLDHSRVLAKEGTRTVLRRDLHPGEHCVVRLNVQAPDEPGQYELEVDLVHEYIRWFDCGVVMTVQVPS